MANPIEGVPQRYLEAGSGIGCLLSRATLYPRSLYLASAVQGGAVGLLLLLVAVICSGWRLLHNRYLDMACLGRPLPATDMSEYLFDCWELIDKLD